MFVVVYELGVSHKPFNTIGAERIFDGEETLGDYHDWFDVITVGYFTCGVEDEEGETLGVEDVLFAGEFDEVEVDRVGFDELFEVADVSEAAAFFRG